MLFRDADYCYELYNVFNICYSVGIDTIYIDKTETSLELYSKFTDGKYVDNTYILHFSIKKELANILKDAIIFIDNKACILLEKELMDYLKKQCFSLRHFEKHYSDGEIYVQDEHIKYNFKYNDNMHNADNNMCNASIEEKNMHDVREVMIDNIVPRLFYLKTWQKISKITNNIFNTTRLYVYTYMSKEFINARLKVNNYNIEMNLYFSK